VATVGGALAYLEWHRGPTHGPLGIAGLGLATAALVFAGRRLVDRRPRDAAYLKDDASFLQLTAVSTWGVLFHVLMDLPTSYGTRFLSPFDWHWHALDWMPIIDIYLWLALIAGVVVTRFGAARQRTAAIVLTLMAADYGVRAAAHERALEIAPRIFGPLLPERCGEPGSRGLLDRWPRPEAVQGGAGSPGRCLVEIAAIPGFSSPFQWRLIAQLSNGYFVRTINLLTTVSIDETPVRHRDLVPNVWTPAVAKAADARPAQVFLGFSRFPAVRVSVDQDGVATVQWSDVRFSGGPDPPRPQNDGRGDLFGARVRVAPDGRILEAQLGGR